MPYALLATVSKTATSSSSVTSPLPKAYFVERTKSGQLPVYSEYKNAGTRTLTVIRKIQGNATVGASFCLSASHPTLFWTLSDGPILRLSLFWTPTSCYLGDPWNQTGPAKLTTLLSVFHIGTEDRYPHNLPWRRGPCERAQQPGHPQGIGHGRCPPVAHRQGLLSRSRRTGTRRHWTHLGINIQQHISRITIF